MIVSKASCFVNPIFVEADFLNKDVFDRRNITILTMLKHDDFDYAKWDNGELPFETLI